MVEKDNPEGLKVDIRAGFAFEDAARGLAAATSPSGHAIATAAGAGRDDGGQGARAGGGADAADHVRPHRRVEVAGAAAGGRIAA